MRESRDNIAAAADDTWRRLRRELVPTAGRTLLQEQLGDARLTADTLGHAGPGSIAGYTMITASRRQAVKASIEHAGL